MHIFNGTNLRTLHSSISSILFLNMCNVRPGAIPILHQNVFGAIGVAFLFRFKLGRNYNNKNYTATIFYIFRLYQLLRVWVWHTQKDKTGPATSSGRGDEHRQQSHWIAQFICKYLRNWWMILNHAIRNKIFANRMKFKKFANLCSSPIYRKENADPM